MRKTLYILLPFLIALILRLYPTFLSGLPFSTDAWPPIRNTELLIQNTPVDLGDRSLFDSYNNYWPANSIFGAIYLQIVGVDVMSGMAFIIPITATLAIPIFYVLAERICGDHTLAFSASILMAVAFPHSLFTAGVTKETYANPIYILIILIFLSRGVWRRILIFTLASIAIVMTHHLTSIIILIILVSIVLHKFIDSFRRGLEFSRIDFILILIMIATITIYFMVYAHEGFRWILTVSDLLSVASYQIAAFTIALYLALKPYKPTGKRIIIKYLIALILPIMIVLLCTRRPIVPEAPQLPSHYIIYTAPFIIASLLATLGLEEIGSVKNSHHGLTSIFWLTAVLGLEGYAIFGNSPFGLGLAYRVLNFLWPPLTLICSLGIRRINLSGGKRLKILMKTSVATVMVLFIVFSCYNIYAAVSLQERYMGYFWLYKIQEYEGGLWIARFTNQTITGDVKTSYLLKGYFNVETDILHGLKYLAGKSVKPQILYIYREMFINGYVIYGGYSIDLPGKWIEKLYSLNLIYSNSYVNVYGG